MSGTETETAARQGWMGLLARAPAARLAALMAGRALPGFDWLRVPETGGVMLRGRTGGTGAPFNLGEMTVTRCTLRLASGETGHAHVMGRDRAHADPASTLIATPGVSGALALRRVVARR